MFIYLLTILILAGLLGYYAIWNVPPSLHSPLMSVTNAISGLVILGALQICGNTNNSIILMLGLIAIFLATINLMGGFIVSARMLNLFKRKDK